MLKRGVLASAVLLLAAYGCDRPNPYKVHGNPEDCPPPPVDDPSTSSNPGDTTGSTGSGTGSGSGSGSTSTGSGSGSGSTGSGTGVEPIYTELDDRVLDYNEALRTASLKLTGNLPTLSDIYALGDADEDAKPAIYTAMIDKMLDPAQNLILARMMVEEYREVFHLFDADAFDGPQAATYNTMMGDGAASRDAAATFAAYLLVNNMNFTQLVSSSGQNGEPKACPTLNPTNGTFTPADCSNTGSLATGGLMPSGVLTDPGALVVYYGNLAMRRNRFYHETFLCRSTSASVVPVAEPANPGEEGDASCQNNPADVVIGFNSVWPFSSISGSCTTTRTKYVDFHEWNEATVCADCHATWNHRAPLWGKFGETGMYSANGPTNSGYSVFVPVDGVPHAMLEDWLPTNEANPNNLDNFQQTLKAPGVFAWRKGYELVSTNAGTAMAEMGDKMATDPLVHSCAIARAWNMVMTRGDIVYSDAAVPQQVLSIVSDDKGEHGGVRVLDPAAADPADPFGAPKDLLAQFQSNGFGLKSILREMLLSEDFLKF